MRGYGEEREGKTFFGGGPEVDGFGKVIHFLLLVEEMVGMRATCYWGANERRSSMVWQSCGKLDEVFRDAWPVVCPCNHAVAPVSLRSVRNVCRSTVLGLGLWGTRCSMGRVRMKNPNVAFRQRL